LHRDLHRIGGTVDPWRTLKRDPSSDAAADPGTSAAGNFAGVFVFRARAFAATVAGGAFASDLSEGRLAERFLAWAIALMLSRRVDEGRMSCGRSRRITR
jgi:hypothetical protein